MPHVILRVRCAHCQGGVELECDGLPGFWGYKTYNEYLCPHCRKQNHERTPGAIISARAPVEPRQDAAGTTGRGGPGLV
jgi:hypothetical protein